MFKFLMNNIFRNMEKYDLSMDELIRKRNDGAIILDVRSTQEYKEGHIEKAINIPYYEINKKIYDLIPNKENAIVVYCTMGSRSKIAYKKLIKLGYKSVYNLYRGLENWQ